MSTKKTKRVYACYTLAGTPIEVLKAVQVSLDSETEGLRNAYFHLSEGEDGDAAGSHFSDEDMIVHLYPYKPGVQLLILTGRATGLRNPYLTPPNILEAESNGPWGAVTADEDGALLHARKACQKQDALKDAPIPCDEEALLAFLAKEAGYLKKMQAWR